MYFINDKPIIMKTTLTILLTFIAINFLSGQYHVVQVRGEIKNVETGNDIERGDKISASDMLKFVSAQSMALVINTNGKYSVQLPIEAGIDGQDQGVSVESAISPIRSRNQISTRGFDAQKDRIDNLKAYFGSTSFAVIGDSLTVFLQEDMYPLNNSKFIVFYYTLNGTEISKKVGFNNQHLIIEKEKLFESKGEKFNGDLIPKMEVYKYEVASKDSEKITECDLKFLNKQDLASEFSEIISFMKQEGKTDEAIKTYLGDYFIDVYGDTDQEQLKKFIEELI